MSASRSKALTVQSRETITRAKRIVVKIGSSSLTDPSGRIDEEAIKNLVAALAKQVSLGKEVVLVSSGAIAAGIGPLGLQSRPKDLAVAQAAASVGQGLLVATYAKHFTAHGLTVGQVLLTAEDTVRPGHYKNAHRALESLLNMGVVPIVNENDTVATQEIKFGDNDRLAALISHLVSAEALILLTDVDGLYTGPPTKAGSKKIKEVHSLQDLADIEISGSGSKVGTGGMVTKVEAVLMASSSGIPVVLTQAQNVAAALAGEEVGTWFAAVGKRQSRRRLWVGYAAKVRGRIEVDQGAAQALLSGKASLLAAGITGVEGNFEGGDPIEVIAPDGKVIGRGLSAYDSKNIPQLMGATTETLVARYGSKYERPVVHRDDLVLERRARNSLVVIRNATSEDFGDIAKIIRQGYDAGPYGPWTNKNEIQVMSDSSQHAKDGELLVAVDAISGRFLGVASVLHHNSRYATCAQDGEAELRLLTVIPGVRGRGVARQLIRESMKRAQQWGVGALVLQAGPENPAIKIYERKGFKRLADREQTVMEGIGLLRVYSINL